MLKAIEIFKESRQTKNLGQAYVRYARIGLYQFNPETTFEYLIKAYPIIFEVFGPDHFETYDIYNMALWAFMVGPSIPEALELIENIDDLPNQKALGSREYQRYQLQKSFILGQPFDSDLSEAVITNYYSEISKLTQAEQSLWLEEKLNHSSKYSVLIKSWLQVQVAIIKNDAAMIQEYCDPQQRWSSDSKLVFKMKHIEACLSQQQFLPQDDITTLNQWVKQTEQNPKQQSALIDQFLQLIQSTKNSFLNK